MGGGILTRLYGAFMILYRSDWDNYPDAIPDYATKNVSWVELASLLDKMGIVNSVFMLALHDTTLQGIDPHQEGLSTDIQNRILRECKINPWYAFREVIRVPAKSGVVDLPLKANRANISTIWLFFNHITLLLIQPRQTGKSLIMILILSVLLGLLTVNTVMTLLTKDDALRIKTMTEIKSALLTLPTYANLKVANDSNGTERLTRRLLGNSLNAKVAQASVKAARDIGRGDSTAINAIDEIAHLKNIEYTYSPFLAAAGAAREIAKDSGTPYGNIMLTTPGFLQSPPGAFMYEKYQESLEWTETFFDVASEEELNNVIRANSKGRSPKLVLEYNHRQLGYTDEWLRNRMEECESSGDDALSDFLNIWPEGNESSALSKELLGILRDGLDKSPRMEFSDFTYITRWYVPEDTLLRRDMIIGLDTSDATGNDDIGLVIRDAYTAETLGCGDYNETNLITFSEWLVSILIKYPKATMIIERQSSGPAIMDNLIRLLVANDIDPFSRIFNWVVGDSAINKQYRTEVMDVPFNRRDPIVYEKYRDKFGFRTTGAGRTSRNILYGEVFTTATRYTSNVVRDKKLINQLSSLRMKNGRIDHTSGNHDDLVVAWLLTYWMLSKTDNMEFYGIDSNRVLSSVEDVMVESEGGRDAILAREKQIKLKHKIDSILEELANGDGGLADRVKKQRVLMLHSKLDPATIKSFNISSVLNKISMEKKRQNNDYWYQ